MIQGQILEDSVRGTLIKKILDEYKPFNIVEIGTWKGLGSTKVILDNLNYDSNFISIESNREFYEIAKKNLSHYSNKVDLKIGRIIELNDVESFIKNQPLNQEQKNWLDEDIKNLQNTENIIHEIPQKINFLLLDGGEFSTYVEWTKLKNKSEIIALDDTRVLKCKKIYEEMIENEM
jgi:predicted O-methyltransferase YrrM